MTRSRGQLILLFSGLFFLSLACISLSLISGSIDISFSRLIKILLGEESGMQARIILELRMPRVLSGFIVGGLLSLAGALMQVLLKNPLAEPYVLGVSGGASVFALLAMLAGIAGLWLNIAAFLRCPAVYRYGIRPRTAWWQLESFNRIAYRNSSGFWLGCGGQFSAGG